MQLRVAACIVIVALVRVLNIAVPVLYRNAVNKLAEVSDLTHPARGERAETFTFMDVRSTAIPNVLCRTSKALLTRYAAPDSALLCCVNCTK